MTVHRHAWNRESAAWLRDQIADFAEHLVLASRPCSMHDVRSRLLAITAGRSWRLER